MRLSEIRSALDGLGLRPSKALGQNFLHDRNVAAAIAAAALPDPAPFAVEIGPGLGSLTTPLLERCGNLLVIEKDKRLAAWLRERLDPSRVAIACEDAAGFDWRPLLPRGPFPLAGNLPYSATSPIIRNFLGPSSPVTRAVFAVQDEFAVRLAAPPGSPDYSALSVRVQRLWNVRRERGLPPGIFHPEPGVQSALVVLERRAAREFPPVRAAFFDDLVQRGFSQRRKQLRSLLGVPRDQWDEWCSAHELPAGCRAESLSVAKWVALARHLDPAAAVPAQHEDEHFDVVDADDRVIGRELRTTVHDRHLTHRAVHMLIFNRHGELLLQKRSAWKDREPSKWDSSAAGHLEPGEDYAAAATRETIEELGVETPLAFVGKIAPCEDTGQEFVGVFTGTHEGPFTPPPAEVEDTLFCSVEIVRAWLAARPHDFAPGFREVWKLWSARA